MRPDGYRLFLAAAAKAAAPRARISVSEWADAHRMLSAKGSSERGRWRTSRTPYLREIMDSLSVTSPTQRVVVMKATQLGFTEAATNWVGYHTHQGLGPMLIVLPTGELLTKWIAQRYRPMLLETPSLREMATLRKRDSANREDVQDFPAAQLHFASAGSESALSSQSIRHAILDEVDRYPRDVGGEGDPVGLINQRTSAFAAQRKLYLISSPTIKGASAIDDEYQSSDQREFRVPCPDCGEYQPLVWGNLQWSDDLSHVVYVCSACGVEIEEHNKTRMLEAGRWVARAPGRAVRGYHLNALYAPIGLGWTWRELVMQWQAAQKDRVKLKRFVNTVLAEAWEDRSNEISPEALRDRAEPYRVRTVPAGYYVLTAGLDTQDDRLSLQVIAWGPDDRAAVIDWVEFPGSPGRPEVWHLVATYLNTPLVNEAGHEIAISAVGCDTGGHFTHEVYRWVRSRVVRRPLALKGANTSGRQILSRPSFVDVNLRGQTIRKGVRLYTVGTDTAKHALYSRIVSDEGQPLGDRRLRFSTDLPDEYYRQLLAEVFDPERNRWVLRKGRRNEATDTWVYAAAAAHHPEIRVHAMRAGDWARLAARFDAPDTDVPQAQDAPSDPAATGRRRRLSVRVR